MSNLNLSEKSLENQVINQEKWNSIFYDNSTTTKVELILNRTLASIKWDNINEVDLSTTDKNYYLKLLNIVVNKNAEIFDDYKFIVNDWQTIFQRDLLMSISYLEDLIYYNLMKSWKYKNAKKLCKENIDEFLEWNYDLLKV